jgi:hypothetical protein
LNKGNAAAKTKMRMAAYTHNTTTIRRAWTRANASIRDSAVETASSGRNCIADFFKAVEITA